MGYSHEYDGWDDRCEEAFDELPPRSEVTIERVDDDTWVVKRLRRTREAGDGAVRDGRTVTG